MKLSRYKLLPLAVMCLLLTGVFASESKALDLSANASYWDVEDSDAVWGVGIGVALPLFTDWVKLDGRAYFFEDSDTDGNGDLELLPVDLGVQLHLFPSEVLAPYFMGGLSYIFADGSRLDVDSDFGGYLGGGLQWTPEENFALFGELLYRAAKLDLNGSLTKDDVEVSGTTINFGARLMF